MAQTRENLNFALLSFQDAYETFRMQFLDPVITLFSQVESTEDAERHLEMIQAVGSFNIGWTNLLFHPAFPAHTHGYAGLLDVFASPSTFFAARPRITTDLRNYERHHILSLRDEDRLSPAERSIVGSMGEFEQNWNAFSFGYLDGLSSWDNIIVAGGAVQACLAPVTEQHTASEGHLRTYFRRSALAGADIDIFVWGENSTLLADVVSRVRIALRSIDGHFFVQSYSRHAVTFSEDIQLRNVQVINRLFPSPAHIISQFDIDAACCLYDGSRVYMSPRSIRASVHQSIAMDGPPTSHRHELRLLKYAMRGYEIWVPSLHRPDIDGNIYSLPIPDAKGLALLLCAEKMLQKKRTKQSRISLIRTIIKLYKYALQRAWLKVRGDYLRRDRETNPGRINMTTWEEDAYEYFLSSIPMSIEEWSRQAYVRTEDKIPTSGPFV